MFWCSFPPLRGCKREADPYEPSRRVLPGRTEQYCVLAGWGGYYTVSILLQILISISWGERSLFFFFFSATEGICFFSLLSIYQVLAWTGGARSVLSFNYFSSLSVTNDIFFLGALLRKSGKRKEFFSLNILPAVTVALCYQAWWQGTRQKGNRKEKRNKKMDRFSNDSV